jgi:predicted phage-related endonuclease
MDLGNEAEPKIRSIYEFKTGKTFAPAVYKNGIMMASLDGICGDEILEIKCCGKETYDMAKNGIVDPKYMAQIQTQLYCSKAHIANYVVYPLAEFKKKRTIEVQHIIEIPVGHNIELQREIVEVSSKFWNNHVIPRKSPPLEDSDYAQLTGVSPQIKEWKILCEQSEKIQEKIEALESEIKAAANAHGSTRLKAAGVRLVKISRAGNVDWKKIIADFKPELLDHEEEYRRAGSTYWSMK